MLELFDNLLIICCDTSSAVEVLYFCMKDEGKSVTLQRNICFFVLFLSIVLRNEYNA